VEPTKAHSIEIKESVDSFILMEVTCLSCSGCNPFSAMDTVLQVDMACVTEKAIFHGFLGSDLQHECCLNSA